jgi:hypothetical protein
MGFIDLHLKLPVRTFFSAYLVEFEYLALPTEKDIFFGVIDKMVLMIGAVLSVTLSEVLVRNISNFLIFIQVFGYKQSTNRGRQTV